MSRPENRSHVDNGARAIATAAKRARSDDATATALVGIGHALLALAGADVPLRYVTGTPGASTSDMPLSEPTVTPSQRQPHGVDVCGWDFDALADITRAVDRDPPMSVISDALRKWFAAQGLDVDELGGGS